MVFGFPPECCSAWPESPDDFGAYRKAGLLPKAQLHPLIASKVYPAFMRGEYRTFTIPVSIFAHEWQKMTGHEPEAVEAIRHRLAVAIRK